MNALLQANGAAEGDWREAGFGLYLHWPFCAAKCPYCDFNSHVSGNVDQARWRAAYRREITRAAELTEGRILGSVYFGGGTPSLMAPELVADILETVRRSWRCTNDLEVTLEANPGSVEAGRFRGYRAAGVNRVSIGVQALNDADLARLGRLHSVAEARAALDLAIETFERVSFDLIYARQGQDEAAWRRELDEALAIGTDHLSLYQLTIEPGTAFGARHAAGGLRGLPDDDTAAALYEVTQSLCAAAGRPAYEVSNHAAPGAESRHNLIYWNCGDYAGIGPGAHGRLTDDHGRRPTTAEPAPQRWLELVESNGSAMAFDRPLPAREQAEEYLMMSLRLRDGVDTARFERLAGAPLDPSAIARLEDLGLVETAPGRLTCTQHGRLLLNAVLRELLAD
ncbi:coproporphyrinogen III oxidase [Rhodobacteraceae bacterium WD3A24]|nr:coproporphyrinogen III oxidase [Rhodobacteraceae bacterium WD3A24]